MNSGSDPRNLGPPQGRQYLGCLFELKRVIFEAGCKILVQGFGLANQDSYNDSRIVIVLEEVGRRQEYKARQASARALQLREPLRHHLRISTPAQPHELRADGR